MVDYPESSNPMQRPRYTGLPTFMRAPYDEDLSRVDIGLAGVPLLAGDAKLVTIDAAPGTYTVICEPHAHQNADGEWEGMVSTLTVR
jgi:hypothetical protein